MVKLMSQKTRILIKLAARMSVLFVIIDTFRINFSFEPKVWDTCHDDTKINEFQ